MRLHLGGRRAALTTEQARARALVRSYTMLDRPRLLSLWDEVVTVERDGIAGAFVECGVWKGGAVAWMSLAARSTGAEPRRLHLFDAFDDICEPDPERDGAFALDLVERLGGGTDHHGRLRPVAGIYDEKGGHGTVESCREVVEGHAGHPAELCTYHVGWFQETVPVCDVGDIAILRLDGDWYASTKVCLDHLYEHVSFGGYVVIDDYVKFDGCRLAVDEFRDARSVTDALVQISDDAVVWRVGR